MCIKTKITVKFLLNFEMTVSLQRSADYILSHLITTIKNTTSFAYNINYYNFFSLCVICLLFYATS